jgi:hypothetical protein
MSNCKTIVTFNSGRTMTLDGDWVAKLQTDSTITQYQFFRSEDGKRWGTVINMCLVESVELVEGDD